MPILLIVFVAALSGLVWGVLTMVLGEALLWANDVTATTPGQRRMMILGSAIPITGLFMFLIDKRS